MSQGSLFVLGATWQSRCLDYLLGPGQVRIDVRAWCVVAPIEDQYFAPAKDLRLIWNYLRHVGPKAVLRKVRSRRHERERNAKFLSIGLGLISEVNTGSEFVVGQPVAFVAYNHPRCVDRVTLDEAFVIGYSPPLDIPLNVIQFLSQSTIRCGAELCRWAGWSPFSGILPDRSAIRAELLVASQQFQRLLHDGSCPIQHLPVAPERPVSEVRAARRSPEVVNGRPTAALFGLGNYAKVCILPHLDRNIVVKRIHEIDPLQMTPIDRWNCELDTSDVPRSGERYDIFFIAGFHHTHAPLAELAIAQGALAVVEKPLATTRLQYERLTVAHDIIPWRWRI
jgi:hypothetical protein